MRSMFSSRLAVSFALIFVSVGYGQASPDSIYRYLGSHIDDVEAVAASPNNTFFASGSWDRTISVFSNDSNFSMFQSLWGHNAAVSALAFSRDGKNLISGGKDYKVIVWKLNEETKQFDVAKQISMVHTAGINCVLYGPGMRNVYSAGDDGRIMIYDLVKESSKIIENKIPIRSIALSTNRRFIYCADESTTVKQYDGLGNMVKEFKGHSDYVNSVAYSIDNKYLVTGSNDKTAIIWDVNTGKVKRTLKGHQWKVNSVAISADSKYVATASNDGTVKFWNMESGELLKTFQSGGESVRSVAFSADQKLIIGGIHLDPLDDREYGPILWQTGVERKVVVPTIRKLPVKAPTNNAVGAGNNRATPGGGVGNQTTTTSKPVSTSNSQAKTGNSNKKVVNKTDEVEVFIEEEPD